jgi:hypothetical protein
LLARFGRRDDHKDGGGGEALMPRPLKITLIEDDREIARGLFVPDRRRPSGDVMMTAPPAWRRRFPAFLT